MPELNDISSFPTLMIASNGLKSKLMMLLWPTFRRLAALDQISDIYDRIKIDYPKIGTCFLSTKIFKMKFKSSIRSRPTLPQHVAAKGAGRQYQKRLNLENRMNFETCSAKIGNDTENKEKGSFSGAIRL